MNSQPEEAQTTTPTDDFNIRLVAMKKRYDEMQRAMQKMERDKRKAQKEDVSPNGKRQKRFKKKHALKSKKSR